jgi:hypothetical protein
MGQYARVSKERSDLSIARYGVLFVSQTYMSKVRSNDFRLQCVEDFHQVKPNRRIFVFLPDVIDSNDKNNFAAPVLYHDGLLREEEGRRLMIENVIRTVFQE